jgi:hypothetical protein
LQDRQVRLVLAQPAVSDGLNLRETIVNDTERTIDWDGCLDIEPAGAPPPDAYCLSAFPVRPHSRMPLDPTDGDEQLPPGRYQATVEYVIPPSQKVLFTVSRFAIVRRRGPLTPQRDLAAVGIPNCSATVTRTGNCFPRRTMPIAIVARWEYLELPDISVQITRIRTERTAQRAQHNQRGAGTGQGPTKLLVVSLSIYTALRHAMWGTNEAKLLIRDGEHSLLLNPDSQADGGETDCADSGGLAWGGFLFCDVVFETPASASITAPGSGLLIENNGEPDPSNPQQPIGLIRIN